MWEKLLKVALRKVLPKWVDPARRIYILAGIDMVGWLDPEWKGGGLTVKASPCARCGACCGNHPDFPHVETPLTPAFEGKCAHLQEYTDGLTECRLNIGGDMPFSCLKSPHENDIERLGCGIKLQKF